MKGTSWTVNKLWKGHHTVYERDITQFMKGTSRSLWKGHHTVYERRVNHAVYERDIMDSLWKLWISHQFMTRDITQFMKGTSRRVNKLWKGHHGQFMKGMIRTVYERDITQFMKGTSWTVYESYGYQDSLWKGYHTVYERDITESK